MLYQLVKNVVFKKYSFLLVFILVVGFLLFKFTPVTRASATVYWYNSVVDCSPLTLGNYFLDSSYRTPATTLPDLTVDELHVDGCYAGNPTFNGDGANTGIIIGSAIFKDSSINWGGVDNATFIDDLSENYGVVVEGSPIRKYQTPGQAPERDFTDYGWVVIADGVMVDASSITYNSNNTFQDENGGYFFYGMEPDETLAAGNKVYLYYTANLDATSIPSVNSYSVLINAGTIAQYSATISNIEIFSQKVVLTLGNNVSGNVQVSYSLGATKLKIQPGFTVADFSNRLIDSLQAAPDAPVYSVLVGTKLYISANHGVSVSVFDTASGTYLSPIVVESYPEFILQVGRKLYVNNLQADSVSVIDTATDTVINTIAVGDGPYFSTVVGSKIYVSNTNTNTISVINTLTDTVTSTITVGMAPWLAGAVGTKLYVPSRLDNNVSVINTLTDTVSATISVSSMSGQGTKALVIGDKVYVGKSNAIAVINSTTDTVTTNITVGTTPYFSCAVGTKMYAVNRGSGTVSVINTLTNTVSSTITVGGNPTTCVVIDNKIYVTKDGVATTIGVIDTSTDTLIQSPTVGTKPFYATAGNNKVLYVSNNSSNSITAVDTTSISSQHPNLISFSTTITNGIYTTGQAIPITATFGQNLQAGSTMTVTLSTGASVVLNTVSGATLSGTYTIGSGHTTPDLSITAITSASVTNTSAETRTSYSLPSSVGNLVAENSLIRRNLGDNYNIVIGSYLKASVGTNPYQLTAPITINGTQYIYVANQGSNTVSVLRKPDYTVVATIPVGSEPYGLATATISGITYIYVANTGSDTISVINSATNTVTNTISVGAKPYYIAALGSDMYVTNSLSNTVSVINTFSNTVTATIPVGIYPRGIKAYGSYVYVANYGDPNYSGGNTISVINSATNTVSSTILLAATSTGPRGVAVLGTKVYVANYRSNNVSVIDTTTNTITATITVGTGPRGIVGLGSKVYVENFDDGTISVIDTGSNTVTATVTTGHSPVGMAIDGTDIYYTRFADNGVSILNTSTNSLRPAAPVISGVTISNITFSGATISWTTDKAATSEIEYGFSNSYGLNKTDASLSTTHSLTLTGLQPGRVYYYQVKSTDTDGTAGIATNYSFSVQGGGSGSNNDTTSEETESSTTHSPDDTVSDVIPVNINHPVFTCPGWSRVTEEPTNIGNRLIQKLKGLFLLAVEDRGSLWYVHTDNGLRYEVRIPTALCLLQYTTLGISNNDLQTIPLAGSGKKPSTIANRVKGFLLIQPQANGQTWYVDPGGYRHSLTITNLVEIAKKLALGIVQKDLEKIKINGE